VKARLVFLPAATAIACTVGPTFYISVLLGLNPSAVMREVSVEQRARLPDVPAGLPSALLGRRPDINQTEQRLVAANANVGVAKAAFCPAVALTGSAGFESSALAALLS
jgi:outer membrane protein, multidrug efflux system